MLSKKLFHWMHRIALFAIVFASLAPSISHVLASQQGVNTFAQEICTTNGEVITIQVVTTKGQQLSTELSVDEKTSSSVNFAHHLNHCPFCSNPATNVAIVPPQATIVALLEAQAQQFVAHSQVALPRLSVLPPPAQAPPQL